MTAPLRLHIGGKTPHPDWTIVDVLPGPHVAHVGSCTDLSAFGDDTVAEIYASHVLEHLGYQSELMHALREFHRVLAPNGLLCVSVPDLRVLCGLFVEPELDAQERFHVMRMMFGGQLDAADFHKVGLTEEFLSQYLAATGFSDIRRVERFGLFEDSSTIVFKGRLVSVNLIARKASVG
jgi:predicted SAM-dependent methyltransferase